ncbi:actin-like ATPase domain-containing protein [Testicularia cyperi]|uniref:Actin-like ATPase domain-containing protein n=1 Tax=Testicularia cyperi TaxID=1882483 RepID=A0A317XTT4_9BASI|nr:actin-like ATPase domain-containing protein [Testicularia cyperi]
MSLSSSSATLRPGESRSSLPSSSASGAASESRKVSFSRSATVGRSSGVSASGASSSSAAVPSASAAASSSAAAASGYVGATRRHSLFGTEDRIVLDIGSKYSKFGFSGEPRPRAIVSSVSISQPTTSYLRFESRSGSSSPSPEKDTLWDLDFARCSDNAERRQREALLLAQLGQLLRTAFSQYLMVDSKQRKVLIVENPFMPTVVKDALCKVLFDSLQVPSVSYVPAPLLSIVAVGKITGLVVDIGYLESSITPVYYGRPLSSHTATTPRAAKRVNQRLKTLLLRYGKFVEAQKGIQSTDRSLKERTHALTESMLTEEILEGIKAKALFVGAHSDNNDTTTAVIDGSGEALSGQHHGRQDEDEAVKSLNRRYARTFKATPFTYAIAPNSIDPNNSASLIQNIHATPGASSLLHGAVGSGVGYSSVSGATPGSLTGLIAIPGWVRERAAEVLFEPGDEDEASLIEMTVATLASLPVDLRRSMCQNLVVTGGTAMLPGFANRFRVQLAHAVELAEQRSGPLSIEKFNHALATGGKKEKATQGALNAEPADDRNTRGRLLHTSVALLNDPWPGHTASDASKLRSANGGRDHKGGSIGGGVDGGGDGGGGSAPAFAANVLAWMGASLVGALKTSSLTEITREAYDQALAAALAHRRTLSESQMQANAGDAGSQQQSTSAQGEQSEARRPPLLGPGNRGSFVGVVGGLETGAFGGLAAVSRHLVGLGGQPRKSTAGSPDKRA